jgi:hypothetical protein
MAVLILSASDDKQTLSSSIFSLNLYLKTTPNTGLLLQDGQQTSQNDKSRFLSSPRTELMTSSYESICRICRASQDGPTLFCRMASKPQRMRAIPTTWHTIWTHRNRSRFLPCKRNGRYVQSFSDQLSSLSFLFLLTFKVAESSAGQQVHKSRTQMRLK